MSTKEEEIETSEECVKTIGNEILFYGDVDRENALEFVEKFKKLEIELLKKKAELVGYEPSIRVHIMSEGGCIFAGMNMMNVLETSRVNVITIAQGSCCSAATFMLLGGTERRMGKNAYILIHQISTEMWGNFQELKHELKSTDKFMKKLKEMYLEKTKIPENVLKRMMRKDIYLSPKDCLKYKIVDALE
jgi:ATP-dependent protease ClpP protease subunit